ncbi:acyltransferase family protein [Massilia glaciei]|uniref:acyltransferase family protein n=1 Tax=Massilia glaciei TaxID=1524097 RepID=UPI001C62870F|nr:acyltransferase [Massilia glaciei]
MGVDLFFVLSGYLIGWQLLKPYTLGAEPRWAQFFAGRALRVLPAYLAVLALYVALPASAEAASMAPLWQFLTFTTNLFPDYFNARAFSHAWSLCVEEHFYLLLPAVVWLLARQPRDGIATALAAAVAILLLAGGMLLRAWIWQHELAPFVHTRGGENDFVLLWIEGIYNPTYARLDALLAGVLLALVKGFRPAWWTWAMARAPLLLAAGLGGVSAATWIDFPSFAGSVFGFPLLAASLALIVAAATSPHGWIGRVTVPGAAPIAAMAFSLYLTHKQVYHWIDANWRPALVGSNLLSFLYLQRRGAGGRRPALPRRRAARPAPARQVRQWSASGHVGGHVGGHVSGNASGGRNPNHRADKYRRARRAKRPCCPAKC